MSNCTPATDEWQVQSYQLLVPVIISLCLLAFLANAAVLLAARYVVSSRIHATLKLTLSLALSDIWTSLFIAISLVYNSYLPTIYGVCSNACVSLTLEAIRSGGLITGIFHLLALSFNHYLSIAYPFRYSVILNARNTALTILLMWVIPPLGHVLYATVIPNHAYLSDGCQRLEHYGTFAFRLTMSLLILFLLLLMVALYVNVLLALRRLRLALSEKRSSRQNLGRERRMLTTTFLICGTFFVGWFPACMQFLLTCGDCPLSYVKVLLARPGDKNVYRLIIIMSFSQLFFIMVKSVANPIIYAIRIPEIQEQFTRGHNKLRSLCGRPVQDRARQSHNETTQLATKNVRSTMVTKGEAAPFLNGKQLNDTML